MSSRSEKSVPPGHIDAGSLFAASVRRFSARTAIAWAGRSRSYGELFERASRVAGGLAERGVQRGDRVLIMFANGPDFVECWWAAVLAGAVVVPLTARATPADLARAARICAPRAVLLGNVAGDRHLALLQDQRAGFFLAAACGTAQADAHIDDVFAAPPLAERPALALHEPCAMYFTAGSTGEPKGVVRSHQSVVWGLSMLAQRLRPDDVLIARAPMGHTGGSLTGPFAVMIAGGTLVIPDASDAASILADVEAHGATSLYVHPTAFAKALLQSLQRSPRGLQTLKRLQWTAGPLPEAVRASLFERFPDLPLEVTYGMTEASNLAMYTYEPPHGGSDKAANCVGHALPGGQLRVVDADGAEVAPLAEGEVQVRTATAFDGYWRDADATARALSDDGWFRTGDVGFLDDDGALHLSGRQREIIKTGGLSVHPYEVEQALAEHVGVADVIVVGRPDAEWDEAVIAAVALHAEIAPGSVTVAELLLHCRERLSSYKVPKELHLLPELPRNGSGKPDRRGTAALLDQLRPSHSTQEETSA